MNYYGYDPLLNIDMPMIAQRRRQAPHLFAGVPDSYAAGRGSRGGMYNQGAQPIQPIIDRFSPPQMGAGKSGYSQTVDWRPPQPQQPQQPRPRPGYRDPYR